MVKSRIASQRVITNKYIPDGLGPLRRKGLHALNDGDDSNRSSLGGFVHSIHFELMCRWRCVKLQGMRHRSGWVSRRFKRLGDGRKEPRNSTRKPEILELLPSNNRNKAKTFFFSQINPFLMHENVSEAESMQCCIALLALKQSIWGPRAPKTCCCGTPPGLLSAAFQGAQSDHGRERRVLMTCSCSLSLCSKRLVGKDSG